MLGGLTDDLEARLVHGDDLMARGAPGGELIVVQCELERGGFERARGIELRKREVGLLREARARLRDTPLRESRVGFRRGAIDEILIGVTSYLRDEDAIWKLAPDLRHVTLHGLKYTSSHVGVTPGEDDWTHVRDPIALALRSGRIRSLGLFDAEVEFEPPTYPDEWSYLVTPIDGVSSVNDEIVSWLVESRTIATLRGLELPDVSPWTLRLLAAEPRAGQIDELELGVRPFHESALELLATTELAPRRLSFCRIYSGGVLDPRLVASPFMRRVTDLTAPGLADLSIGRQLRRLSIDVSFEPGWVEWIANAPELSGLEELVLSGPIGGSGTLDLRALQEPTHLESLRVLRLWKGVTADAARELLCAPIGRRLEAIDHRSYDDRDREKRLGPDDWDGHVVVPEPRG